MTVNRLLLLLAVLIGGLAAQPALAAKPARLGEARLRAMDREFSSLKLDRAKGPEVKKASASAKRILDRYATKVRKGTCQKALRANGVAFGKVGPAYEAYTKGRISVTAYGRVASAALAGYLKLYSTCR